MKLKLGFTICVLILATMMAGFTTADDVTITLDLNYNDGNGSDGTWQLFGRIDDTGNGTNGEFGLAAVRALIDDIDFGTGGDAITFASGIGAMSGPTVMQHTSGTIDLFYGQDLSESQTSVVSNVGNSGDTLLSSGTFSAGANPDFGQDNSGATTLFTQALFLNTDSGPFGPSIDADNTLTVVNTNLGGLAGDYNLNGIVDAADYTVWFDSLGSTTELAADGDNSGTVDTADHGLWQSNFNSLAASATASSVPEPSALNMMLIIGGLAACNGSFRGTRISL